LLLRINRKEQIILAAALRIASQKEQEGHTSYATGRRRAPSGFFRAKSILT
jgi:hypothetical protein